MKNNSKTETETEPVDHSTPIEISIIEGETSGIIKIDGRTGAIEFAEDLTFEQWKMGLRLVRIYRKRASIAAAEYLAIGIKKWGRKKVDEALEQLELELTLVKTAVAVNSVPRELIFENINDEHFVEISKAQLPKAKAIKWARIASEQRLTPAQLRLSIVHGEVVDRDATKMLSTGMITIQGIRQSFDIWYRRVGGINGVRAMDLDHQIEIAEELDSIMEFGYILHEHLDAIQKSTANAPDTNAT
jgi:hypothetical protein